MQRQEKTLNDQTKEAIHFLKEMSPYLLSHHNKEEYFRCIQIKKAKICARCFGIYAGIIFALIFNEIIGQNSVFALAAMPGLFEWTIYKFKKIKITPKALVILGFLMGIAWVYFIIKIFAGEITKYLVLLAIFYFAAFLIAAKKTVL
ncbi:MAG: DUF2085 domain-containing protein [Candidatus Diapherotrites archaeon]